MGEYLMEVLRPRIEKEKQDAVKAAVKDAVEVAVKDAVQDCVMQNLFSYVQEGGLTVDFASKKANQTPAAFIANMRKAGYTVPKASA